jgi:hypothetical protein
MAHQKKITRGTANPKNFYHAPYQSSTTDYVIWKPDMTSLQRVFGRHVTNSVTAKQLNLLFCNRLAAPPDPAEPAGTTLIFNICFYDREGNNTVAIAIYKCQHTVLPVEHF